VGGESCEDWNLCRGLGANQGHICKGLKISRDLFENLILNTIGFWLILVKSIENHRKMVKIPNHFFSFLVNNTTSFLKHDPTFEC
jgi:hypothetical protein